SIQDGNGDEPSSHRPGWLGHDPLGHPLSNPLVWPYLVYVFDVLVDYAMKLPVPENQDVIEAIAPRAPQNLRRSRWPLEGGRASSGLQWSLPLQLV
ncbi:MAG TPA: hypothetical protein VJK02_18125, partial [Anaerolineales bacterium]|nr:hypothetical protein [Anaerolineales bacterium]